MKTVMLLLVLLAAACGNSKPAEQPPSESAPASPGSAWTQTGGPATPGVPATGPVESMDGGKR